MFFKQKSVVKSNTKTKRKKRSVEADEMVECQQCGVYVEISEAILSNGKYYCSNECLKEAK